MDRQSRIMMQIPTGSKPSALTMNMKMRSVMIMIETCSIKKPKTTTISSMMTIHRWGTAADDQIEHATAGTSK